MDDDKDDINMENDKANKINDDHEIDKGEAIAAKVEHITGMSPT
jgi:hypothetical protein